MKVDNITLMMFVLNFVEFCFILELIYSSDFHEGRQYFMLICGDDPHSRVETSKSKQEQARASKSKQEQARARTL